MSSTSSRSPDFEALFDAALANYSRQTGQRLVDHPLTAMLDQCNTPDAILAILERQAQGFDGFWNGDPSLIKWLRPVVNGMCALANNSVLCTGATSSLAFPAPNAIFSGIGVLLSCVRERYDALVDIFEWIENLVRRLRIHTEIPFTPSTIELLVKIMSELLSVLALATKQINQGRLEKKYAKKWLGGRDIESALQRLDRLTLEESRTTAAQTLDVVYGLVKNMVVIMEGAYHLPVRLSPA
ncbi:hypothetical protein F5148DRAFT_522343 [Russula earlei]|uniref:Uncharacterized protein n=1 Tax=Russula earlei TaxID=71964 RepID=A0ACC0UI26_9AGAM|nr:hypothetical protein F5148DRAFT_522343 [Russula earlei]